MTKPQFAKGDRVTATVGHMPGMLGKSGEVEIVRTEPAYYGLKFDGEDKVHKWLAEDEIKAEEKTSDKKDGDDDDEMDMRHIDAMKTVRRMGGSSVVLDLKPSAPEPIRVFHRQPDPSSSDRRAPRSACLDEYMAIQPAALERAFFPFFFDDEDRKPYEMHGSVAVLCIDGPLMQRGGWWYDGYEQIQGRFRKAMEDRAVSSVVLKINSPGGVCAGCFTAGRAMRDLKAEHGKPVFAYADESAYSAAYAMACIADEICLPPEGGVGSVGVIATIEDWTAFNERVGIKVAVISSGKYKADGHPDMPLKADAIARYQARIDSLAGSFAEFVAASRGTTAKDVLALEAGCFYGADAVNVGLANGVATLSEVISKAQSAGGMRGRASVFNPASAAKHEGTNHMTTNTTAPEKIEGTLVEVLEVSHADFALAAGLPHDASKGDVLAEMARKASAFAKLVEAHGAKSADEAIGKLEAERTEFDKLLEAFGVKTTGEAVAKLNAERKEREVAKVRGLIEEAVSAGKCPANGEKAFALYEKHGMAALEAHLDALVPHAAVTSEKVTQKAPTEIAKKDDEIVLTAEDEKFIELHGLSRDEFIAARRTEIADAKKAQAKKDAGG